MSDTNEASIFVESVKIDGAELEASVLVDISYVRVSRSIGSVGHTELRVRDNALEYGSTFPIGAVLDVGVVEDGVVTSLFVGSVTSVGVDVRPGGTTLVVEALDDARKLGNAISLSSDLVVKASDIIESIASAAGLTPNVDATTGQFTGMQVVGTPLQFLDMLASRYGYQWRVEESTLYVGKRATTTVADNDALTYGENLQRFAARLNTSGLPNKVRVRGWDPAMMESIVGEADVQTSGASAQTASIAAEGGAPSDPEQVLEVIRASVPSESEANVLAAAIARRITAMQLTGNGETLVNPRIAPGGMVKIAGLDTWSGDYHVTSVEHSFGADLSFTTRFTVGSSEVGGLSGLLGGSTDVTSHREIVTGISIGIVTNNFDEHAEGPGPGCVKVKIPNIADDHETFWARVVSPGAGAERGLLMLPEVDDEVAVAFENGDIDRPYVLGGLWNGNAALPANVDPVVDSGAVAVRSITSRGGAYVALSDSSGDSAGERFIDIVTADGAATVHIGEDNVMIDATTLPVTFKNDDASIELTAAGAVTITAGGNLVLDAGTNNVEIKGGNVAITAESGDFTADAAVNAKITGAMVAIEGDAKADIKATIVNLN